jgi:phosphatidylglycerophosphatase C
LSGGADPLPVRAVAAFDFDGTLVERDSLLPFLQRVCGTAAVVRALALESPRLAGLAAGGDRDLLKARLFGRLLAGRRVVDLERVVHEYAEHVTARRLRSDMLDVVDWHRREGHELVIVSASPELYLVPIGRLLDFDAVLGTRLEVDDDGRLTGRLTGRNVRGAEKVARVQAHLGEGPLRLWAYGDSGGDRELLALADVATRVTRRRLPRPPPSPPRPAPDAGGPATTSPGDRPASPPTRPSPPRGPEPGS